MQHATDQPVTAAPGHATPESLGGCCVVTLAIAEMECASCAHRIRNALLAHPGVHEAEADPSTALARVWYDPARVGVREILAVVVVVGEGTQHRFLPVPLGTQDGR